MELTKLENVFKEKTLITFALVNEDGSVREETCNIFHWPLLDHATEGMLNEGTTLLARLFAAERDTDNPVPVVTRQLRLLGVYSNDLTVDGQPLSVSDGRSLSDEEMKKVPLSVQQKIATSICAPLLRMMAARGGTKTIDEPVANTEGEGQADADDNNQESLSGDRAQD